MADYTEEQRVKQKWPKACVRWSVVAGCWIVSHRLRKLQIKLSDLHMTPAEAWADASRRLGNEFVDESGPLAERKEG